MEALLINAPVSVSNFRIIYIRVLMHITECKYSDRRVAHFSFDGVQGSMLLYIKSSDTQIR